MTRAYSGTKLKANSVLCRSLRDSEVASTLYIKEKWEREQNVNITLEVVFQVLRTWREFGWKNFTRYFITPKLKSKQTGFQHTCWRLCGEREANHAHILWECHKLNLFRESEHNIMKDILGYVIPEECKVMYLGSLNYYVPEKDRYLARILLVTCKKANTRNWCKAELPTTTQWLEIREVYIMARMTHQLRIREGAFVSKWEKWMQYDIVNDWQIRIYVLYSG